VGGTVDVGAYEFQSPLSIISYAWLQQYGLPVDGSVDHADPDMDLFDNWQESRAATLPFDATSFLKIDSVSIDSVSPGGVGILVTWQCVNGLMWSSAPQTWDNRPGLLRSSLELFHTRALPVTQTMRRATVLFSTAWVFLKNELGSSWNPLVRSESTVGF
jgi:hypothetical protein